MLGIIERIYIQVIVTIAFSVFSPAVAMPVVSIQPSSLVINNGQQSTFDVLITDVVDLYGFQFDIIFSPDVFFATSITEGALLANGGATLFIPGEIDNDGGTISFTADTLLGPDPGVTGSGILASFDFIAYGIGISTVSLSNLMLLDSTLTDISFTAVDTRVEVHQPTVVPEPGTLILLGAGLFGLVKVRRQGAKN